MSDSFGRLVKRLRKNALADPLGSLKVPHASGLATEVYFGVASILDSFADGSQENYPRREELTRAIVVKHQHERHNPLWGSLLVIAYYPMLSCLRHSLICQNLSCDDLDQIVIMAFLTVIAKIKSPKKAKRLPFDLRQRTRRLVFAMLRDEWREQLDEPTSEVLALIQASRLQSLRVEKTSRQREELSKVLCHLENKAKGIQPDKLAVIDATVLRSQTLREYVDGRVAPDVVSNSPDYKREYQRLKRCRTRTVRWLREKVLAPA